MQRIVVLNPKGGSGKTTIAINLASHFARQGECPVLMDYDVRRSSSHWVRKRHETQAQVHLVSVLPSDIDIQACSRRVQNLLLVAKVRRRDNRLGIIANRVRRNTLSYQSLIRFLGTLGIPVIATLRDSQNYMRAAELGLGLEEMNPHQVDEDLAQWQSLFDWLEVPSTRNRAGDTPGRRPSRSLTA